MRPGREAVQQASVLVQIKAALALHAGKDVITCTATGAGNMLSFWIALLMAMEEGKDKMIFVVTPLNLLGKQNVDSLCQISSENANATVYKVSIKFRFLENRKLTIMVLMSKLRNFSSVIAPTM